MNEIAAGLASAKFLFDSLRAASRLATDHEVRTRIDEALESVADVRSALLDAQTTIGQQLEELRQVRAQLHAVETWEARAANYEMVRTPGGAVVFRSNGSPQHDACPVCFASQVIVPIQPLYSGGGQCPKCKVTFELMPGTHRGMTYTSEWDRG